MFSQRYCRKSYLLIFVVVVVLIIVLGQQRWQQSSEEIVKSETEVRLMEENAPFLQTNTRNGLILHASRGNVSEVAKTEESQENLPEVGNENSLDEIRDLVIKPHDHLFHCGRKSSIDISRRGLRCSTMYTCLDDLMAEFNLSTKVSKLLPNFYITAVGTSEQTTNQSNLHEYRENPHVGFVHLPKTGGTSVERLLKADLGKRNYSVDAMSHCNNFFKSGYREIRQHLAEEPMKPIFALSKRVFGIHRYVVDDSRKFLYLTWFRKPISRHLSTFYYIKKMKSRSHKLYNVLLQSENLTTYLNHPESLMLPEFNNYYIRLLTYQRYPELDDRFEDCCGAYSPGEPLPEINEKHYLEAKQVLENEIAFVGITEEFKLSQDMLCDMMGLPQIDEIAVNKNAHLDYISEFDRGRLFERNYWEIKLYEDALKIFAAQKDVYQKMKNPT